VLNINKTNNIGVKQMKTQMKKQPKIKSSKDLINNCIMLSKIMKLNKLNKKIEADLKEQIIPVIKSSGGRKFLENTEYNVLAKTIDKEYKILNQKQFREENEELFEKYKNQNVSSTTLDLTVDKK
jgi:predicted metalloendopeptidase